MAPDGYHGIPSGYQCGCVAAIQHTNRRQQGQMARARYAHHGNGQSRIGDLPGEVCELGHLRRGDCRGDNSHCEECLFHTDLRCLDTASTLVHVRQILFIRFGLSGRTRDVRIRSRQIYPTNIMGPSDDDLCARWFGWIDCFVVHPIKAGPAPHDRACAGPIPQSNCKASRRVSMSGWKEISEFVLKNDYCCGCGVCAGVCPQNALEIRFNEYGEYRPYLTGECTDCGLCSAVCPYVDDNANEDELGKILFEETPHIKHTVETGYYLDTFVGYFADPQLRWNCASGGMATWLMEKLLRQRDVDAVLCVSPNDDSDPLFRYMICRSTDDVRKCSRSCYYPVTTQEVLSFVNCNEGRYAIIGLPCVCKAIRLAQQKSPRIRDRIKYVVGLACGQTKSKGFVEYICALGGGDPHRLSKVEFRVKDASRRASDFGLRFTCTNENGSTRQNTIFWTQGMNYVWLDRYFTLNACNFCDDVFADCADVVFMDAWLPEYRYDPRGHSLVLTRDSRVNELFRREVGHPKKTVVRRIDVESIIRSQVGGLCSKRGGMRDRMILLRQDGLPLPVKRWKPKTLIRPFGMWRLTAAQYRISRQVPAAWVESRKDLNTFMLKTQALRNEVEKARQRYRLSYRILNGLFRRAGLYRPWATTRFFS